jgi:hypothetical protein
MLKRVTGIILAAFAITTSLPAQSPTSTVAGVHSTEDGKSVSAIIRLASKTNLLQRPVNITTNKDGSFSFAGIPAGTYEICSTVTNDNYVDDCLWTTTPPTVTVLPGQAVTGVNMTVKKAATLKVHVNDPGKLIKDSPQGALLMGVMGAHNRFYPVVKTNSNSNGNDYQALVPYDTPFFFQHCADRAHAGGQQQRFNRRPPENHRDGEQ